MPLFYAIAVFGSLAINNAYTRVIDEGTSIRVYNATQSHSGVRLDLLINGNSVANGVTMGSLSGPFSPADHRTAIFDIRAMGGAENLLEVTLDPTTTNHVLVLNGDPEKALYCADLAINAVPYPDDQPRINILNAIPRSFDAEAADIYLLASNQNVETAVPVKKAVTYKSAFGATVAPGSYTVVLTKADTKSVLARSDPVELKVSNRKAVIAVIGPSGTQVRLVWINL